MAEAAAVKNQPDYAFKKTELLVNMGPQHPSTHGVLRVILTLDGEQMVDAQADVGYLHRCFEKIAEGLTYPQVVPYTDRTDYVGAITSEWAYCLAVERLAGIEVPERAEYIRVIFAEMQRIASHLIFYGTFGLDMGATTPFIYAIRDREVLLDLFELVTGARLTYNYVRIGGVRNDLPDEFFSRMNKFLDLLEKSLDEYHALLTGNRIFKARVTNVGVLSPEDAIAYGATGPTLRGSGVPYDLRKVDPYGVYDRFDFDVPVGKKGDILDRYNVRMEEIRQSMRIIRQAMDSIPQGDVMGKVPRKIKPPADTDIYVRVESPKGEIGVYLASDGSEQPYRLKWRAPSFNHLQLLPIMAKGHLVADMVLIIGSIDIVLGEVDR